MRVAALGLIVFLLVAADPAHGQEDRDHTHNPTTRTANARVLLRMLAPLQESFVARHGRYATTPAELRIPTMNAIRLQLAANGSQGYSAVAVSPTEECVLYRGTVQPPRDFARQPDRVTCRPLP